MGYKCGRSSQQQSSIAIGDKAGSVNQSNYSIAIGCNAGTQNQGDYSIAIGYRAGETNQFSNSIIINATTSNLDAQDKMGFYVSPIREQKQTKILYYDAGRNEITYGDPSGNGGSGNLGILGSNNTPNSNMKFMYYDTSSNIVTYNNLGINLQNSSSSTIELLNIDNRTGGATATLINGSISNGNGQYNMFLGGDMTSTSSNRSGIRIAGGSACNIQYIQPFLNRTAGSATQIHFTTLSNTLTTTGVAFDLVNGKYGFNTSNLSNTLNVNGTLGVSNAIYAKGLSSTTSTLTSNMLYYDSNAGEIKYGPLLAVPGTLPGASTFGTYVYYNGFNWVPAEQNISLGSYAGQITQGSNAVAIGAFAGRSLQGELSVAVGAYAGQNYQDAFSVAIGAGAGRTSQDSYSVAIGYDAGTSNQLNNSIAVGYYAGKSAQGMFAVAIGDSAGETTQKNGAVAIGASAGEQNQGCNSIAIGPNAGRFNQSDNSIAIGNNSGYSNQHPNTIIINASTLELSSVTSNTTYINPIRSRAQGSGKQLYWDPITSEIFILS
jgi:hypothetical protein